jgi:hypothetical protein
MRGEGDPAMSSSKFDGLFNKAGEQGTGEQTSLRSPSAATGTSGTPKVRKSRSAAARKSESPTPIRATVSPAPRMGRPPGKKSDPAYRQVTVYLPVELHDRGREIVFRSRGEKDFSEIVEEALRAYFRKSGVSEV